MSYATQTELERASQIDASDLAVSTEVPDGESQSEWDMLLSSLQAGAKARIDNYCRRDFEHHTSETVTLSGKQGTTQTLRLPHPVLSVESVTVDGTLLSDSEFTVQENGSLIKLRGTNTTGHIVGSGTPPGLSTTARKPTWPAGWDNISVVLSWGYQTPPADVKQAEIELVKNGLLALSKQREAPVIQTDDFEVSLDYPNSMTSEIRGMLGPYRKTEVNS